MCVWRAALFTILVAASFNLPVNAVVIQSRVVRRADVSARSQFYLSREDVEINMQTPMCQYESSVDLVFVLRLKCFCYFLIQILSLPLTTCEALHAPLIVVLLY